jgi:seryl-tRNA synthetase
MLPDEQELSNVRLQVGLLERDVKQTDRLCNKLSESIEKMQEMSTNMIRMITLHEQKHEHHEESEKQLKEDIKELHSRITTVNRELHDRMDQIEQHISSRIDALRTDLILHKNQDKIKLGDRIAQVEKWQWMVAGGIAVISWLIGQSDFVGKLFK